tara:strand:+ start:5442 stop:8339 length:2898 start_codon:yes stop_codon:yes gene_type:complete
MEMKVVLLSGVLALLMVSSGFLIIANETASEDDGEIVAQDENQNEPVNNVPSLLIASQFTHQWDGMNSTISGFVTDEQSSSCYVIVMLLDSTSLAQVGETFNVTPDQSGAWSMATPFSNPGTWIVQAQAYDQEGQSSDSTMSQIAIVAPDESDVLVSFLWAQPLENSSIGTLQGLMLHMFPSTCSVEYHPLGQSPARLIVGDTNQTSGQFTLQVNTSYHNTVGDLIADCGMFSSSSSSIRLNLPVPPEPEGDEDSDGVLDESDECDNTPLGEPVYASGCSDSETDTDMDGVMNDKDQCPNTPTSQSVDANGCADSQKDTDNDGINNVADICPNTPAGESVDLTGCSESQKDDDGDGVTNNLDECPNTPAGETVNAVGCSTAAPSPTPMKILALHGGGDSASGLASQQGMQDLMDALPEFEFVFASTPESGNVWYQDPPGGKGEPTTDPDWADLAIAYLDQKVIDDGPFYGLIGYSQGSAMIPVYLANTENTFNRVMLYNGYLPTTHHGLMDSIDDAAPFSTPAMIFSGENDGAFKDLAPALAQKFTGSLDLHSQTAGHHLPYENDEHFDQILTFIQAGIETYDPVDSWYCQDGTGPWVRDDNGVNDNYNSNTNGVSSPNGGGSGPWFKCIISVTSTSTSMTATANGIPNHNWISAFGPGDEQSHTWQIPLNPVNDTTGGHNSANCPASNGRWECAADRGQIAVASNGVPIFGPEEGPGGDAVALDFFYFTEDRQPIDLGYCGAHAGPTGVHYHWDAMCQYWVPENGQTMVDYDWSLIDSNQHSPIIGWSFDGYPIYGMYTWNENGVVQGMKSSYEIDRTSDGGDQGYNGIDDWTYVDGMGDLDECNGRFGATPEYPDGTYYYVSTPLSGSTKTVVDTNGDTQPMIGFPYFLLCYHGIADDSNAGGGQGGGGGGGGFIAQTIYQHMPEVLEDNSDERSVLALLSNSTWVWVMMIGTLYLYKRTEKQ